ncbi:uncharacterized protein SAPINGB_P002424 [Magnusiomyces paraingens]|uniref:CNH domain-containing protein n=1 Tax=Magnusiomyces paraingens TaxID=2606893 RepID=A0A5E8BE38_9ASCO|nr:uncharacterized protein SAPINGB_P002424 [Saprochaete ingens]VVT49749.1 unnamed protein product [Saprochaete ingens]
MPPPHSQEIPKAHAASNPQTTTNTRANHAQAASTSSQQQLQQQQQQQRPTDLDLVKAVLPQRILGLPSGERAKISALRAYSDKLLVGLTSGTLLVYSIDDPLASGRPRVTLIKTIRDFAPKGGVDRLGVLRDAGVLVALCDNVVSVYDLETLAFDETLSKTRGATTFAITFGVKPDDSDDDSSSLDKPPPPLTTVSRLVVACKRRLVCYEWRDSEFSEFREINMPDRAKSLEFLNPDRLVCGLGSGDYCTVDIPTAEISSIALPEPSSAGTHTHSFASVGISAYIGLGSRSPFPHATALPDDHTAFLAKDTASQFVDEHGHILDRPAIADWTAPPEALGYLYPYLLCVLPKHIELRNPYTTSLLQTVEIPGVKALTCGKFTCVATQNQVFRFQPVDLRTTVQALADKALLEEAISLLEHVDSAYISNREDLLRKFKTLKAIDMLKKKKFEPALALFSSVSADPKTVVELFPAQISGSGEDLIRYTDSVPNSRMLQSRTLSSSSSSSISSKSQIKGGKRTVGMPGTRQLSHTDSLGPPSSPSESVSSPTSSSSASSGDNSWSEKELSVALRALVNFLADTRRKIALITTADDPVDSSGQRLTAETYGGDLDKTASLVDTTMFKCYVIQSPALIGPLLRIHNHCDPAIVRPVLSHYGKWKDLIDFYFGKAFHREALELLRELSKPSTTTTAVTATPDYLKGPEPTVRYLQRLDNKYLDLIFEFAKWPLEFNATFGEDIFLEDSSESESLDREKVLAYLEDTSRALTIKYLEHVIFDKKEQNNAFHTALAINYIKSLSDTDNFDKLVSFLKPPDSKYKLSKVLLSLPAKNSDCTPQQLEIKAILYGKQGDARTALMIYTFELKDDAKAHAFCGEVYDADAELGRRALHTLISLYLTPPESVGGSEKQRLDLALDLLATQGSRMSVVEIINRLPEDTKIHDIAVFLTSQIRGLRAAWNGAQVDAALRKVHLVKVQEELLATQQKHTTTITSLRTCRICLKRLGHSVISVFPDGTAIHYGCARIYQEQLDEEAKRRQAKRTGKTGKQNGNAHRDSISKASS